ncbi:hypothetical protein IPV69_05470 [Humisphaera borealis]|uniref:Putative Flp pilus-assembly TadG-like N-terminal domain-containing protein n=2 Tax=Humisphaera borealis TaxID=2807512 RepID=A0A7M2WZ75_9BACT|nr:hypothetical protein IPV69_05470 [Humisphaera borealis]
MVVLLMMATFAVDWGRAQLAKTELQSASDAAARYGVAGLKTSVATATSQAKAVAAMNSAAGTSVVLTDSDIEFGLWDPGTRTFEVLTGAAQNSATAIRVTARRTQSRSNPLAPVFASALRLSSTDITTSAIAARGNIITATVIAKGSPWLAGMGDGSTIAATGGNPLGCVAPTNSPTRISSLPLTGGMSVYFRQTTGQTSYENSGTYGPDGQTDWIVRQDPANGINSTKAPIMSLVGIFLDDRAPNTYSQAAELDFTTENSRNFSTLSPGLKQVFFIGDGMKSDGTLQSFVVPAGATRFYMGLMDEKGWWWDNVGQLQTTMLDDKIAMVK